MSEPEATLNKGPWYREVTKYQWLVLIIASAGWVFDVYEGQIFNITRGDMLKEIITSSQYADVELTDEIKEKITGEVNSYGETFLAIFLLGGTLGGLGFGSLADRYGRRPIMMVTILMYSLFSGLTYFAQTIEQVAILRFLVAMGVGGEWAVAASLVAEVFPPRIRAQASGLFHASSVLGTAMAGIAGMAVGSQWRYAYLIGILPALLILWVRASVKEPEKWQEKKDQTDGPPMGSFKDLLTNPAWYGRALGGMLLAAVGLGTFWSVTVAGQDLTKELLSTSGLSDSEIGSKAKFAYGIVQTIGGGLGLITFGPLAARFGRKNTFILYQLLALVIVPITCFLPQNYTQMLILLPIFGFFTLGIHAGFAIYFPELFPTHLRATGTSFCFNGGRLLAVPVLIMSGKLKGKEWLDFDLPLVVSGLSLLFVLGIIVVLFLPETKEQELPE